ncbi:MAG: ornithine cyclodeaminase family protein [Paracoccaceae bacterium]|nr:ornithine cyclodeaminase family protein [Paracoccaceae bacterium]
MTNSDLPPVYITYLNRFDIETLALTDAEILAAIEESLAMQGRGETVIEPRMHIEPRAGADGHFNVLRGWIGGGVDAAGVKVVGDFVDNYRQGRPSEYGVLTLFDPRMGAPRAILDASGITDMRTGAMTAVGAKYLARQDAKVLGNIGARGSSYWNVRLLDHLFDFEEIRVHSRRPESRNPFAERLSRDLGKTVVATEDWESCLKDADIIVEASRLSAPEPLFKTEWVKPGAFVVPYGTMSAVEITLTDVMDKLVVDDWGQCKGGKFGALRAHVEAGKLSEETLHAEMGQVVAGSRPGRERPDETILFWHRGLSLSDMALGHAMLKKAERVGLGQRLRFC